MEERFLTYDPIVFVMGENYCLMCHTVKKGAVGIRIGERTVWDACNGVVRSEDTIHRVTIPQALLDGAKSYTVIFREYPNRQPYYPEHTPDVEKTYAFRPVDETRGMHVYFLADAHEEYAAPSRTGSYFGDDLDLLILGGDIGESLTVDHILNVYRIAENLTHGSRPVVYCRGNHDCRGILGEVMPQYVATDRGNTYFTFRVGSLWGIVLDAGEDKIDGGVEYNGVAAFNPFREEQAQFVKRTVAEGGYAAEGVKTRLAICHLPFTEYDGEKDPNFDQRWARPYYTAWVEGLNRMKIDLLICGHMHQCYMRTPEEQTATDAVPNFPLAVGSKMSDNPIGDSKTENRAEFTGTAMVLDGNGIRLAFTNSRLEKVLEADVPHHG